MSEGKTTLSAYKQIKTAVLGEKYCRHFIVLKSLMSKKLRTTAFSRHIVIFFMFLFVFLCSWLCWMLVGGTWDLVTWEGMSLWPLAWGAWVELRLKLLSLLVVLVWLQRLADIQPFQVNPDCWGNSVDVIVWICFLCRWTRLLLERDMIRAGWWRLPAAWSTALNVSGNREEEIYYDYYLIMNVKIIHAYI